MRQKEPQFKGDGNETNNYPLHTGISRSLCWAD